MTKRTIEYFYSTHSAYAYLGAPRLMEISQAHGCSLVHRPFELSPVVEQAGGLSFAGRSQAHVDYFFGREIERWAQFRGLDVLDHRPTHHDNALHLSSGVLIAAHARGLDLDALSFAFLQAHWRDDIDLDDADALATAALKVGIDAAPLIDAAMKPATQAVFEDNTQRAKSLNLFGSPTYILQGEMFYGQDHLELLNHALTTPFTPSTFRNPSVAGA
ncbi:2-hydroxychromene-2-carboxylate isomerase [Shimia sp. NS0008-38b]|uniref:2-hydroxychromene-2-carboxylate isomerase n=1 Tax=Shimia sp. NS0008-38b TaxID=3127653 RepID=UPI0031085FFF